MTSVETGRARILDRIDPDEVVALAERLIATPSQCGLDDEMRCAEIVADYLDAAGVPVELTEVLPGRPNVVGRLDGAGAGPSLMLNGHLDTTPMDVNWVTGHTVTRDDGMLRGHGARNMKGGLAALLAATAALGRSGIELSGDLRSAAVMGHHDGGIGTRALLAAGAITDFGIFPEPTDLGVRTVQTGSVALRIEIRGRTGPAGPPSLFQRYAGEDDQPVDAVEGVQQVLSVLPDVGFTYDLDPDLPDLPLLQVRHVVAGYGAGRGPMAFAPDSAAINLGVYTVRGQGAESVRADVARALRQVADETGHDIDVVVLPGIRHALDTDPGSAVVAALVDGHREVTGTAPAVGSIIPNSYFGCDGQIAAMQGCEAVSYGPASHAYRRDNRGRLPIDELVTCARTLAVAALTICSDGR